MITKFIGFQLDLSSFHTVNQIIQMNEGYVIFGSEVVEQKLKSIQMQLTNQKLLHFEIKNGKCVSEKPYQIGQGLGILSNIVSFQNYIIALISRQGTRSLTQFNPLEHTVQHLLNLPYKQYQIDCDALYMIFCFNDRITLVQQYNTAGGILIECLNYPNGYHTAKKFNTQVSILNIKNTTQIAIICGEDFYCFDGNDQIFQIDMQLPAQFKIKFMLEINDEYVLIVKDRVDKFYKFLNRGNGFEYFHALKKQELLDGQMNVEEHKKQSINLTSNQKNEFLIWVSTIYENNDSGEKILYVNTFKITDSYEPQFIQGFKLWKAKEISFVQKDEFVHDYLLYRNDQTVKAVNVDF